MSLRHTFRGLGSTFDLHVSFFHLISCFPAVPPAKWCTRNSSLRMLPLEQKCTKSVPQVGAAHKCYAADRHDYVQLAVCQSSGRYNSEVTSRTNRQSCGSLHVRAGIHRATAHCHKESVLGARSHNHGKRPVASSCPSVCPSFRMEQLGSHRTDCREIWY